MKRVSLSLIVVMLVGCATTQPRAPEVGADEIRDLRQEKGCKRIGNLLVVGTSRKEIERMLKKQASKVGANYVEVSSIFQGKVSGKIKAAAFALHCPVADPVIDVVSPATMVTELRADVLLPVELSERYLRR